jgi:L-threonylcarbamoyladenylate synthase
VAQALLGRFAALKPHGQGGVAAPSANKFGHVSPTRATHVRDEFPDLDDSLLLILEGGASEVGVESTIVDLSRLEQGVGPVLLRPGHITAAQIGTVLGRDILRPDAAAPQVSGSLKAHYAPRTPLALLTHSQMLDWIGRADPAAGRFAVVVFGAAADAVGASRSGPEHVEWHIASADPQVYARELYALLRRLDRQGYAGIAIERPPQEAAWQAINDRLGRAAAAFE